MESLKKAGSTRLGMGLVGLLLLTLGFALGRWGSSPPEVVLVQPQALHIQGVQFAPQTPEELIPLNPGPGQGPGQIPGNQPGQQQGDCPIFIYQDGRLYQLPRPGQQPGQQQPGPGQGPGRGIPGGPQELIPLQPAPGLPMPSPLPSPLPDPEPRSGGDSI